MTILSATFLPLADAIAGSEWTLVDASQSFEPTFAWGPAQVVEYATAKWYARLRFEGLSPADRNLLARFCSAAQTKRSFWVHDYSHNKLGTFVSSELLLDDEPWTPPATRNVYYDSDGMSVRIEKPNGQTAADQTTGLTTSFGVTANAAYAYRGIIEPGAGSSFSFTPQAGSTRTGVDYGVGSASAVGGRFSLRCLPTAGTMYVSMKDTINTAANWANPGWYVLRRASVVRCALVDGGSGSLTQSGNGVFIDTCPTNQAVLLKSGDMVEIASGAMAQMVRLIEDARSDGNGESYIKFEPMLRMPVSDNDLVIPTRPLVKMRLASQPAIVTRPGWYGSVELECIESFI